jgi:hypothetical protein
MSLSSLIVQREIATIRQVEEALARQVLYGGDLVTNLLEVAPIEEWRIAVTFADSFGLAAAPPGQLALPPPDTLSRITSEIAARRGVVPISSDAQRMVLAASEPLREGDAAQIAQAIGGLRVEVRIALDVRVREALLRAYGVPLDRRMERLVTRLVKQAQGAPPPPKVSSQPPGQRPPSVPPFRLSPAYGISAARSPLAPHNREDTPSAPELAPQIIPAPAPAPAPEPQVPPAPPSRPRHITQAGLGIPAEPPQAAAVVPPPIDVPAPPRRATGEYAETKPTFVKPTSNSVRPVRRHRGPLTAEAANEELEGANDRETLLDLFFDFSRQFFDYAALFIAHGEIAEGRDAFGDGASRERVVGIGVPLDLPSMFATAREKKEPVIVRPSTDGVDGVLLGDLRRPPTVEAFVVPLLVRGRPVAILYADVRSTLDLEAVESVTTFAKAVGQGFEKLIVRKKLAGFTKGAPNSAAGKLDMSLPLPEKKAPVVPGEKVTRATTLGKALFEGNDALLKEEPPQEEAPAEPPQAVIERRNLKTDPQTPLARGSMPAVLTSKSEPPPPIVAPKRESSNRPPPPQLVALVRPSGPPIPREEPEAEVLEEAEPSPEPEAEVSSETLDDEAAQALLAEIAAEPSPIAEDGAEVLMDLPPAVPESDQAVSVGPRRPPTARNETSLPSIMVDIAGELSALVERVLTGGDDGVSEGELLRQGASAMPAIMARFPGPLVRSRTELAEPLPRPSDCGPLLRLIARQRKVALAYVLEEVASPDVSRRFWGTYLLVELPYAEGARLLVPRLFDPDPKVRLVARAAARSMVEVAHEALFAEIGRIVRETATSRTARLGLLEALGDMREAKAVALLIGHLGDDDPEVSTVARRSLIAITRQDYASDTRKWLAWWGQNSSRHRIEWLIDALSDETPGIRRAAGEELKALTQETFGYYDDLPKRERERAQQRFRDWWASEGRARFVRS